LSVADGAGEERLTDFLIRISGDLSAIATWYGAGNSVLLAKEGGRLRDDHRAVLEAGKIQDIHDALEAERKDGGGGGAGGADVSAHQLPHIGPCWVLVG
jgi:hypothetical protein